MTTQQQYATDDEGADLLTALAHQQATVAVVSTERGADPEFELFTDACRHDGYTHGGFVSQNRVRAALSNDNGLTINPRRYSAFWQRAMREGLITAPVSTEPNLDKRGRNLGKRSKVHRWAGDPR